MKVSPRTVDGYRDELLKKLNVQSGWDWYYLPLKWPV